jgi:hypothetical protein
LFNIKRLTSLRTGDPGIEYGENLMQDPGKIIIIGAIALICSIAWSFISVAYKCFIPAIPVYRIMLAFMMLVIIVLSGIDSVKRLLPCKITLD